MDCMKGPSEVVIACQLNPETAINLVHFPDGSWGITRSDAIVGIWEPDELDECFEVFAMQVGIDQRHGRTTVILRTRQVAETHLN
jgi:hypothetical protein